MAFRKVSYLIPSCDGCGLAWSFRDPACVDGLPPHFASRVAALEQLPVGCGWQIQRLGLGGRLMACRQCVSGGVIPDSAVRAWLLVLAGWVRRVVPFGPVCRVTPTVPAAGHPESVTEALPVDQEERLAAMDDELFPDA
jgi:hypothetical protein